MYSCTKFGACITKSTKGLLCSPTNRLGVVDLQHIRWFTASGLTMDLWLVALSSRWQEHFLSSLSRLDSTSAATVSYMLPAGQFHFPLLVRSAVQRKRHYAGMHMRVVSVYAVHYVNKIKHCQ